MRHMITSHAGKGAITESCQGKGHIYKLAKVDDKVNAPKPSPSWSKLPSCEVDALNPPVSTLCALTSCGLPHTSYPVKSHFEHCDHVLTPKAHLPAHASLLQGVEIIPRNASRSSPRAVHKVVLVPLACTHAMLAHFQIQPKGPGLLGACQKLQSAQLATCR